MGFFESLGNAVSSAVSSVGSAAETVVTVVTDAAEAVVEGGSSAVEEGVNYVTGAISNAIGGGTAGKIIAGIGGAFTGFVKGLAAIVVDAVEVVRDAGGLIGAILSLDFARAFDELLNLLIDAVGLVIDIIRFVTLGTIVGGIIDAVVREDLRQFVLDLVNTTFSGQRRTDIISNLGLTHGAWGLNFNAKHNVFMMDSNTIDLRAMHNAGTIDLFALAGLLSFNSFQVFRPRTYVKTMNAAGQSLFFPANRYYIGSFLKGNKEVRLQVFALKPEAVTENMRTATKAFKRIGIRINWIELTPLFLYATETPHSLTSEDQFKLEIESGESMAIFFDTSGLKLSGETEKPVVAAAAFHYEKRSNGTEGFGRTSGRRIIEGTGPCATAGRTDGCCSTVNRGDAETPLGSGVIYRDQYPFYVFKYVLTHELGHYFGLCHPGHNGFQDIMFTAASQNPVDPALARFYYEQEPTFTNNDGKNAWRFIVNQLSNEL